MKLFVLYLFYIITRSFVFFVSAYNVTAPSSVRLGEAAQATYSSQHPPVKNQQDYVIVLAQKNAMGLYPQNNIGTSIIAKGNKEDPRTGPTGSVNFTIFQTGTYAIQMYEGNTLFGQSGDIIAQNSSPSSGSTATSSGLEGSISNAMVDSDQKLHPNQTVVILVSVLGSVIIICATVIFVFWYRARRFGRQESAGADFSSQASSTVLFKGSKMLRDAPIPPGSTYLSTTVSPSDSISQIGRAPKFIPQLPGYQGRDIGMGAGRKYEESISESELEYSYNRRRSDIEKADGIRDDGLDFPYSIPVITTTAATPSPPSTLVESLRNGRRDRY